jgi:hypothetical protein
MIPWSYSKNLDSSREDLIEFAWGIIANASGGNWSLETLAWQNAARAWRNQWHAHMRSTRGQPWVHFEINKKEVLVRRPEGMIK